MISGKRTTVMATVAVFAAALSCATVMASDLAAPTQDQPATMQSATDLASRVKQALHSDPSVLDKHIEVSMKNGKVVMSGFVTSADDLHKVVRMADQTAGEKNVVNNLTIKEGGGGGAG